MSKKHPIQPTETDGLGVVRFKEDRIVSYLLENGGIDLNKIAMLGFSTEDQEQFAQLIGYSMSGFAELSYVSDETYCIAERMHDAKLSEAQARNEYLESIVSTTREALIELVPKFFKIHPDDLEA